MKIITKNKKAFHDYSILDKVEAGIVLTGDEVKALRAGNVNLVGSFAHLKDGELYLINAFISPYSHGYSKSEEQTRRSRKLLLHRREINRLVGDISKKGITLIPLSLYFDKNNRVKVELGLCKHKKAHDKKQMLKERDIKRETQRALKGE